MSIINTILAKDERAATHIRVMSEFLRGISDIEYEPGEEKIWKEKYPQSIYYYFRYNDFKFISKRDGFEEALMDKYQDDFMNAIKQIPQECFDGCQSIIDEAESVLGSKIGKDGLKRDKLEKKMVKTRNELSKQAQEYQDIEEEFLQEYFNANASNIQEYMKEKYDIPDDMVKS